MTAERWQEVKQLFASTIVRAPNERSSFLARQCGADAELRREAERLVAAHERSRDFIETPAFQVAPEFLADDPDALIGQRLGAYRIDAVLGSGGMGVVYLAYDERLERKVALKLLPRALVADETQLAGLKREARTASALNHPNVVTIHEIGEVDSICYIATEFIDGTTLRERMAKGAIALDEAVEITRQVASALCVAHRAGIVHRDIKPENIMLRPDGYVKVLDFGIAKGTQPEATAAATGGVHVTTRPGVILGTTRYMSPEQARGQAADARSDLWSLGVVLYEMLAARPPFDGPTPTDVMAAVLLKEPQPLEQSGRLVPAGIHRIVKRSLRKYPAERYQTADEMLADLRANQAKSDAIAVAPAGDSIPGYSRRARWIGMGAAALLLGSALAFYGWRNRNADVAAVSPEHGGGLAVLPFENLSADAADAFWADGLHEDVLGSVGKLSNLKVIARSSVMDYRAGRARKVREIGRALRVSHVLEGSVRRISDRIVVNVALIDTRDEHQVWSERYERTLSDALSLQGELAIEIARALHATLTPAEARLAGVKPTQSPEAYLAHLRASQIVGWNREQVETQMELYQQAVDLDPGFVLARARLALSAIHRFNWDRHPKWQIKAVTEAEEVLRTRPDVGEARLALAQSHLWADRDYDRALRELAQAAELLPNSAEVPLTAAFIYKWQNRYRDRVAALERAEALDPRNRRVLGFLANTLRWLRQWPAAIQALDRLIAVSPEPVSFFGRWLRASDEFRLTAEINVLKAAIREGEAAGIAPEQRDYFNQARYDTAVLERNYAEAARFLSRVSSTSFGQPNWRCVAHSKPFHEALLAVADNSDVATREQMLDAARKETETRLVNRLDGKPDEASHAELALLNAFSGRKEEAIRHATQAVELTLPGTIEQHGLHAALALVYTQSGEPEKAIDLIEHLLTVPGDLQHGAVYNMTLTDLKWRWIWDPLRDHPRFQKLLAGPEPNTVY